MIKIKTSCSPSLQCSLRYNSLPLISKFHPPSFPSIPSPPLYSHIYSFPFLLPSFFNFLSPSLHFLHPSSLFFPSYFLHPFNFSILSPSIHPLLFYSPSLSLYLIHPSIRPPLLYSSSPSLYFLLPSTPFIIHLLFTFSIHSPPPLYFP